MFVRKGTTLAPMIHGCHHENSLRAGTENVPGAVGLGRAAQWVVEEGPKEWVREATLRDRLEQSLLDSEERSREHAERLEALWGIANNPNLHAEELMLAMLQRGRDVHLPKARETGDDKQQADPLVLSLTPDRKIWVESVVGKGSVFYFTVPRTAARQELGEATIQSQPAGARLL